MAEDPLTPRAVFLGEAEEDEKGRRRTGKVKVGPKSD